MATQQRHHQSHGCRQPQQWPRLSAPLLLLLLLLLIAGATLPPVSSSAISVLKFWSAQLPSTQMPPSLSDRISPLTPVSLLRSLWYIKKGLLSSFGEVLCNSANLVCDSNAGLLNPEVSETDSTLDKAELFVGSQISLPDSRSRAPHAPFLPRILSHRVPFRNESLPALLQMLHIPSSSPMAHHMQRTLSLCDEMAAQTPAESVTCATSVEQMVQFATSRLGSSDLEILQPSLPMGRGWERNMTVTGFTARDRWRVVHCRELVFPYAVFLCEAMDQKMQTVEVDLEGRKGKGKGVVQCHRRGEGRGAEVCEWLREESLVWVGRAGEQQGEMAWRNEKFHFFSGTQSHTTNIFNVSINKNTFKNHGDVNFEGGASSTNAKQQPPPSSSPSDDGTTAPTNDSSNTTSQEPTTGTGTGNPPSPPDTSPSPNLTSAAPTNQNLSPPNLLDSNPTSLSHNPSTSTSNPIDGSASNETSTAAPGGGGGGGASATRGATGGGGRGGRGILKSTTSSTQT